METPRWKDAPDLVIVSGPLASPEAQEQALHIAQKQHRHALLVGVCTSENAVNVPSAEDLQRLYASYHAVLAVADAQCEQLIERLFRTIVTFDGHDQWLASDWSDIRHMLGSSGPGLVRHGSACHVGSGRATTATSDAIAQIERDGGRLHTAHGICIGLQSGSQELYGREIKEVLSQVRAAAVAGVTMTLSAGRNPALEPSALVVNIFAFGERGASQLAYMDTNDSVCHRIDAAAFAWAGENAALDPLYPYARSLVLRQQRASISLIQRHLRVGYGRAVRLFDAMKIDAVSAPDDGLREVLLSNRAASHP